MADDENEKRQQPDTSASEFARRKLQRILEEAKKDGINTKDIPPDTLGKIAQIVERSITRHRQEPTSTENTGVKPIPINTKRRGRKPKPKKP